MRRKQTEKARPVRKRSREIQTITDNRQRSHKGRIEKEAKPSPEETKPKFMAGNKAKKQKILKRKQEEKKKSRKISKHPKP